MNTLPNSSRVSFENPKAWPHSGSFSTNNPMETDYTAVRPWESFKSRYHWQNLVVCFYHCSFYKFYEFLLQLNFTEKAVNRCACLLFHSLWFPGTTKVGSALVEWRRRWHPTPVLLPGKSHGRRSLVGYSPWGREESDTTEWLHFHSSLSRIEGNGNPLQCSCLENPRDGRTWWAAIYGVTQSRTRLKWLSSSSSIRREYRHKFLFFREICRTGLCCLICSRGSVSSILKRILVYVSLWQGDD